MAQTLLLLSRGCLLILGICCAYQWVYTAITLVKKPEWNPGRQINRYAVLICARNESKVIAQLIECMKKQDYTGTLDVYVAADNCTDDTAAVARNAGAVVYERQNIQQVGKGYALDFLLQHVWAEHGTYDGYFVFDADNLVSLDFVRKIDGVFGPECPVVAGYRNSKNYSGWVASGQALCFLREVRYLNAPRTILKSCANVTGTGFVISHEILQQAGGWPWHLLCEDLEFSTEQMLAGRRIAYCLQAEYFDEQPESYKSSVRQRLRWCKGFMQVMNKNGSAMAQKALHGCWACADLLICRIAPVVLNLLAIIFAVAGCVMNGSALAAAGTLAGLVLCAYGSMLGMAALTTVTEWKRIRANAMQKITGIFTFPLYMATYLPIALQALVCKVEWSPVVHTKAVSLQEFEKEKSEAASVVMRRSA